MKSRIIRKENFTPKPWSGGTTTELYIYPENAIFKDLNFDFRISIATVEIDKSIFTSLPGVSRTLMVLEGSALLEHKQHHSNNLSEFEQDKFEGGWNTICTGVLKDFNLMTTKDTKGTVEHLRKSKGERLNVNTSSNTEMYYVYHGEIEFQNDALNTGDLLILHPEIGDLSSQSIQIKNDAILIHVSIANTLN